jgi:DNA-binding SARP family transcriptional activator/class 3 adenylate cyclase
MSDIEGSTRLLKRLKRAYAQVLADHARIVREAAAAHGGREIDTQGDAFFLAFSRAREAVAAAAAIQQALAAHEWPEECQVRVRIGVHTGEPDVGESGYVGLDVHRVARICSAAHGGQVVVSQATAGLAIDELPDGASLRELGEVRLKDLDRPERLSQLVIPGLEDEFPPLRAVVEAPFADVEESLAAEAEAGSVAGGVEVRVLGPVEAWRDDRMVAVSAPKQRMILAALALRVGEVVSADELIDALWGERPPATAAKALQVYVSELRKLIEADPRNPRTIVSQPPGYRLVVDATDLQRFERLWEAGRESLAGGDAQAARTALGEALGLWRASPLLDLRYEAAFGTHIGRLEELRAACVEDRIDADLRCGRHAAVVAELEALVGEHPLRERLRVLLMLALYRSGRQADALSAYQSARQALVDELGIDPSPALVDLERQILRQDPALLPSAAGQEALPATAPVTGQTRTVIVLSQSSADAGALTDLAAALGAESASRDVVLARLVTALPGRDVRERLREVTRRLAERRDELHARGVAARVAAFSSAQPGEDVVKLADHQDAELVLMDGTAALVDGRGGLVDHLLANLACDVALHLPRDHPPPGQAIMVPFSGSDHDWAALELAAVLARAGDAPLVLLGTEAGDDGRDASRLLATASLIIQRTSGVIAEPLLVAPGAAGILDATAADAGHILIGLSPRFREDGLGDTRYQLARTATAPVTFIRRGTRPGVLAPQHSLTRYTWSVTGR